jgi:hypothetical protein
MGLNTRDTRLRVPSSNSLGLLVAGRACRRGLLLCCRRPRHGCFVSGCSGRSCSRLFNDRSAGTQGQGNATKDRSKNDQFVHKLNGYTKMDSSQVASPNVLTVSGLSCASYKWDLSPQFARRVNAIDHFHQRHGLVGVVYRC